MGAWGTGLYQDDIAEDVKLDYYKCFREDGLDNEAAYQKLLSSYSKIINDPEGGAIFWFALSDTMWDLGRLTEEVKEKALYHINAGKDIERWGAESEAKAAKRKQVLAKLKEKLESPMPKEKKIGKKRIFKNKWQLGDMYVMPIEKQYPRFPDMTVKYLLLLKVDDRAGWKGHIEPVVYIIYLKEMYYDGMDLNSLDYAVMHDQYWFVVDGIAGRPLPDNFIYVGNYGDLSKLEKWKPTPNTFAYDNKWYHKALERVFIGQYLINVLGVSGKLLGGDTVYMTDEEYQEYCFQMEEAKRKREAERKANEYYACPWDDGDVFYLPIRETVKGSELLLKKGYVGMIMVKVGTKEDTLTTNIWPVMLICCVKKEYGNVDDIIREDIFNLQFLPLKTVIVHKKDEKIPSELTKIGNVLDISVYCHKIKELAVGAWRDLEWSMKFGL